MNPGPVNYFTGAFNAGYTAGNGMSNFRICEGQTATFLCPSGQKLNAISSFYGSPSNERGYRRCRNFASPSVVRNCDKVENGANLNYVKSQCNGKGVCQITVNNGNMGGDPCPGTYKFLGVAIGCSSSSAQSDEPNFIDDILTPGGDQVDGSGNHLIKLSSSVIYLIGSIIFVLLLINLACLCYHNCTHPKSKNPKYGKISQIASSDEEMQNLQI